MGTTLIAQAHVLAARLCRTHAARLVLQRMCLQALDPPRTSNPMYFGGSDVLAVALGYTPDDPAGERAVRRALAELVDVGLVEQLVGVAPRTHHRRWLITLPGLPGSVSALTSPVENPVDDAVDLSPEDTSEGTPVSSHDRTPVSAQTGHLRPLTPDTDVLSHRTPVSAPEEQHQEAVEEAVLGTKPRKTITAHGDNRPRAVAR